jgi:hypothetical protein
MEAKFGNVEKYDKEGLASIEMKFFRRTTWYTLFGPRKR